MNIYSILYIIIIFLTSTALSGQYRYFGIKTKFVSTAKSGLNMRSKPSLKSDVITKIPYLDTFKIVHVDDYGTLSLGNYQRQIESFELIGKWYKAKYQGLTGYVHSSYMRRISHESHHDPSLNQDVVLLKPGWDCQNNLVDTRIYSWYGLYVDESLESELRSIEFEYINNTGMEMVNQGIITRKNQHLKFIIGSKTPLSINRKFQQTDPETTLFHNKYDDPCGGSYPITKNLFLEVTHISEYHKDVRAVVSQNGKYQCLNPYESDIRSLSNINFVGDIDGDGTEDYILQFGEKSQRQMLFLSSFAKQQNLVEPLGCYYSGYCC